jgi:hypothetical protein
MDDKRPKFYGVIVSDSRAAKFESKTAVNTDRYESVYVVRRGGTVLDLKPRVLSLVRSLTKEPNVIVLLQIAAGINELTIREQHEGGREIFPRETTYVWENILDLKERARRISNRVLCSIATIPIISLVQSQQHYMKIGWLKHPKYSAEKTNSQQESLSRRVQDINKQIIEENRKPQNIGNIGDIFPKQRFWSQNIEKSSTKRKQDGSITVKRRIPLGALPDGVHANDNIIDIWYRSSHENFKREVEAIENMYR